jgi:hypothetical protein
MLAHARGEAGCCEGLFETSMSCGARPPGEIGRRQCNICSLSKADRATSFVARLGTNFCRHQDNSTGCLLVLLLTVLIHTGVSLYGVLPKSSFFLENIFRTIFPFSHISLHINVNQEAFSRLILVSAEIYLSLRYVCTEAPKDIR